MMNTLMYRRRAMMDCISRKIPSEYQQVEYIESTGTQYIATRYIPQGTNLTIEWDFEFTKQQSGEMMHFGAVGSNARVYAEYYAHRSWYGANNKMRYNGTMENKTSELNRTYHAKMNNSGWSVGSASAIGSSGNYGTLTLPIYIFAWNNDYSASCIANGLRIYSLTFTEGTDVSANYIPCYRKSDDAIGMYDTVSHTFFANAGTGTFLKGADV